MAEVQIAVAWISLKKEIAVTPPWATVCWGKGYEDTARWTFSSDEPGVFLDKLEFKGTDKKGPFQVLEPEGPDKMVWEGGSLKPENGDFDYHLVLSNGEVLDPGVRNQEHP